MCEAAPGSVEAIKTAAQVIMLQESRTPWGVLGEAQLLRKLKEISDRICKAIWKGFTEQMLADYSFKSKETPSIPSLHTQTTRALPWALAMATQHRRWPHLCRDPGTGVLIALPCRYHPLTAALILGLHPASEVSPAQEWGRGPLWLQPIPHSQKDLLGLNRSCPYI